MANFSCDQDYDKDCNFACKGRNIKINNNCINQSSIGADYVLNDLKYSNSTKSLVPKIINGTNMKSRIISSKQNKVHLSTLASLITIPNTKDWSKEAGNMIEGTFFKSDITDNQSNFYPYTKEKQQYVGVIRNQNNPPCGCCWAMAVASVVGDRWCIKHKKQSPWFSPIYLMSCSNKCFGDFSQSQNCATHSCECGGAISIAANYLLNNKIGTTNCWPFTSIRNYNLSASDHNPPNNCPQQNCCYCSSTSNSFIANCSDISKNNNIKDILKNIKTSLKSINNSLYIIDDNNKIDNYKTINLIKTHLLRGPVVAQFIVFQDFYDFWDNKNSNDIYSPHCGSTNEFETFSGHAVAIVGWGKTNDNKEYWLVRNSWGPRSPSEPTAIFKFLMSIYSEPKNWTGIDIPLLGLKENCNIPTDNNSWLWGGCLSFEISDTPLSKLEKDILPNANKKIKPLPFLETTNPVINFLSKHAVLIILIIILCLILFTFLYAFD